MTEKSRFSDAVEAADRKFKEIEAKRARIEELKLKKPQAPKAETPSRHEENMKQQKQAQNFRLKEKLTHAAIVFVIGHALLIPMYLRHPELAVGMFICASLSLGFICLAVIDYT